MRDRVMFQRQKVVTSSLTNPSLTLPTRGFGLQPDAALPQAMKVPSSVQNIPSSSGQSLQEEVFKKPPLGHDISRISLRPQAKLTVSQPEDPYEQEADWVADQVMRMRAPELGTDPGTWAEQNKPLMRKEGSNAQTKDEVPPIVSEVLQSGGGRKLDDATRAFMEPRFGHDFSQVQVHTDARAAESAQAINALAYTVGPNVVFGAGQYAPGTTTGKRLLAHELTHVVQQTPEPVAGTPASESSAMAEQDQTPLQRSVTLTNESKLWLQRRAGSTESQLYRQEDETTSGSAPMSQEPNASYQPQEPNACYETDMTLEPPAPVEIPLDQLQPDASAPASTTGSSDGTNVIQRQDDGNQPRQPTYGLNLDPFNVQINFGLSGPVVPELIPNLRSRLAEVSFLTDPTVSIQVGRDPGYEIGPLHPVVYQAAISALTIKFRNSAWQIAAQVGANLDSSGVKPAYGVQAQYSLDSHMFMSFTFDPTQLKQDAPQPNQPLHLTGSTITLGMGLTF